MNNDDVVKSITININNRVNENSKLKRLPEHTQQMALQSQNHYLKMIEMREVEQKREGSISYYNNLQKDSL